MNKDLYLTLEAFYSSLNERLQQMIAIHLGEYLDTLSEEDKDLVYDVLKKKRLTLLDINDLLIDYSDKELDDSSLVALVYHYFDDITGHGKEELVSIDFPIQRRLEKVPTNIPKFLMLPILSYLISSSNKYQSLTRELYGNYLMYLENDFTDYDLKPSKLDVSSIFDKLSVITTDSNYEITLDDINLLSSFLSYERYLPGMEMKNVFSVIRNVQGTKNIIISYKDTDFPFVSNDISFDDAMKVYSHFFKLELSKKCTNRYLYAKETFDSITKQEYSKEELKQISLLLHTLFSKKFYRVPGYYLENFQFEDILSFIKKYEETGLVVSKADLSYLLDKYVVKDNLVSDEFGSKVRFKYYQYGMSQFPFQFEDLCSYMNDGTLDFSSYKYDRTKDFDFSMYTMFCTFTWYCQIAGYFDPLMKTRSGQELLSSTITSVKEEIQHQEDVYSVDTYQRFYSYAEKLASLTDYTLDYFLLDFVDEKDYEKVRTLCTWINQHNPSFFSNSIGRNDIRKRNSQRILHEVESFFEQTPLKELTRDKVELYWKSLINPFVNKGRYPMNKPQFFEKYNNILDRRLDELSLSEVKNMELCIHQGKSLLDYISRGMYTEEQAFHLISIAGEKIPEERDKFFELQQQLQSQIDAREERIKQNQEAKRIMDNAKKVNFLMTLFLNSDYSSMADFYQDASKKLGLQQYIQREMLKNFTENNADINDVYQEKRAIIDNITTEKTRQVSRDRYQAQLDANVDMYGEEAIRIMKKFIDSDDKSISKFCSRFSLSMSDFKFYRKLCRHIDQDISGLVDDRAADIRRKFIGAMARTSVMVAKEMVQCHNSKTFYDMVKHYELYGYSPVFIKDVALSIGRNKEAKLIGQYMSLHPDNFRTFSANEFASMVRTSQVYPRHLYLENQSVSYLADDLENVTNELCRREVPITKGTVFSMLKRLQEEKIDIPQNYQKNKK